MILTLALGLIIHMVLMSWGESWLMLMMMPVNHRSKRHQDPGGGFLLGLTRYHQQTFKTLQSKGVNQPVLEFKKKKEQSSLNAK